MRKLESTYDHPSCGNIPLERQADSLKENDLLSHKITLPAFQHLKANLEKYGNVLTPGQEDVLLGTLRAYTDMAQGKIQGRYAIPLPTGFGKTQSITSWIYQLYKSGIKDTSVAICATKVEELCSIKRQLLDEGVPDYYVGLYHSYKYNREKAEAFIDKGEPLPQGFASLPATDRPQRKQILLVTHQRVKGYTGVNRYNVYKGRVRDLVIWDESLFISESVWVDLLSIRSAFGGLKILAKYKPTLKPVAKYLGGCLKTLNKECESQDKKNNEPQILEMLTQLSTDDYKGHKKALESKAVLNSPINPYSLIEFLIISQSSLRVYNADNSETQVITYEIKVPEELENILVLDASHDIRQLSNGNAKHINKADENSPYINKQNARIDYSNVTVHYLENGAGRTTFTREQSKSILEERRFSMEVAELVKTIPENEAVLIFTFKARDSNKQNHMKILKDDMKKMGIDTDASFPANGKPRIVFLSWGQETAINRHSYCKHIIFAGVLHRAEKDIAAEIIGESNDLTKDIDSDIIKEVIDSEVSHCVYQAISRGNSRHMMHGKAGKSDVYLILSNDRIKKDLIEVMPGLNWKKWQGKHIFNETMIERVQREIMAYLNECSKERISSQYLRKQVRVEHERGTFKNALDRALQGNIGWRRDDRSIVRA